MKSERKKILYYSDCPFFAGCENMLANIFSDERITRDFQVSFAFRSTPEYLDGLKRRIPKLEAIELIPIHVRDPNVFLAEVDSHVGGLVARLVKFMLVITGYYLAIDFLNLFSVLVGVFRGRRFDLVHINNGGYPGSRSALAVALANRLCSRAPALMVVNNIAEEKSLLSRLRNFWWDLSCKFLGCLFVTASKNAGLSLRQRLGLTDGQVISIHNGVAKRSTQMNKEQARAVLAISENVTVMGMVAILEPRKGHRIAIEAVSRLFKRGDVGPFVLLIEGAGPYEQVLRTFVDELKLGEVIKFVGSFERIADFYMALDFLLVPSLRNEDFPNVILEAMSFSLPVIGSDIAGIPEQIIDGETGFVLEPGNVAALERKMKILIEDEGKRVEMGRAAQRFFEQRFTSSLAVTRYIQLYKKMLASRKNPMITEDNLQASNY